MIKKATPDQRKPLETKVVQEWNKVREANDLEQLRGFVKVFGGMFEAGTDAKITLADKLSATGNDDDGREAEYMLLALRDGADDPAGAAKATEALARLYIRKGLLDDAVGMYAELGRQHARTVVRDGKTGADLYADLITDKRFLPYLEPAVVTWAYPKLKAVEAATGAYPARANQMDVEVPVDALPFFKRNRVTVSTQGSSQGWALKVTDRVTGEDKWTSPGFGYGGNWQYQFQSQNVPYKFVQVKGHVAVVTMHSNHPQTGFPTAKVHAFDLADRKKLWELDLFGTSPNQAVLQQPPNQAMEADGMRLTYQDGWSTKVGQQWVVEATYTLVLTKDGLIAKDNARGTVLWTKANVSTRTHMVGDGEYVFLYDVNQDGSVSPVRCYRASDGVEVPVPDSSGAFTNVKTAKAYGRRMLVFDADAGKKAVRLYDLYAGKDVWKKELGGEGWALKCEDDAYAGFVTAAGDVTVLAAADGKEVFRAKLDAGKLGKHLEKVNDAMLFSDADRFFVVLNRPNEGQNRFGYQPALGQAIRSVRVNGVMYAFERASGKRLWHTDEQLEDQAVSLEQFADLPLILAASQVSKFAANGNFEGQFMKVAALDKATGKLKYARQWMSQGQQYTSVVADPKTGTIDLLSYGNQRLRFVPDDGKSVGAKDGGPAGPGSVGSAVQPVPVRIAVPPPVVVPVQR
jgi:hypothetical protein